MNRSTEEIARDMITGLFAELAELCDATNDDRLSAWEMARQKASEVVMATDTVCRAIAARQDRSFLDKLPQVNTAEEGSPKVGDSIRILREHWATKAPYSIPAGTVLKLVNEDDGQFQTEPFPNHAIVGIWVTPSAYGHGELEIIPAIPTETPEESEEMDRIEQGGGLHPLMADLISPFVQRKLA